MKWCLFMRCFVSFVAFGNWFRLLSPKATLQVPKFNPYIFDNSIATESVFQFCNQNRSGPSYADIFPTLENEARTFLMSLQSAGGMKAVYLDFLQSDRFKIDRKSLPQLVQILIDNSIVWDSLDCCIHPTSFLGIKHAFGCPTNVSVCVYDRRMDRKDDLVALTPPAGCCPIESPNGCFSRLSGGGLRGCCPDDTPHCCFADFEGKWLGCARDVDQCCGNKICPEGYTCCRSKNSGFGSACCPKYGGSCFNDDYYAYGLDRDVKTMDPAFYDDTNPNEVPKKLSEHFGLVYGYHPCLPIPGGVNGPVGTDLYLSDWERDYADGYCEDHSERTTSRIRPHVARTARSFGGLDQDGEPFYSFDNEDELLMIDLNIPPDAQQFGGIADLDFIECGRHLCYGERDRCVYRYKNRTIPTNFRVIDIEVALETYETLLESSIVNGTFEPIEPNYELFEILNETCHQYNDTYLNELISAGPYANLLTGEAINPKFEYLLPFQCILYDMEYEMERNALGCCPRNSTPCASFPHSLIPNFRAEYPNLHSLYDPMYGCALPGETCCGGTICPIGFKCCDVKFTVDGGLEAIRSNGETPGVGHLTDLYLRAGVLYDLLINATAEERRYLTGIFDVREHCCPDYSFCCQVDTTFNETLSHGRRFLYYCASDPLCMIPIWKNGADGVGSAGSIIQRGYPSQFLKDDLSIDFNSDGKFDYETDILPIFLTGYPAIYAPSDIGKNQMTLIEDGNHLLNVKCSLSVFDVGGIINCGQLAGNFTPAPPPPNPALGVRAIGSRPQQPSRRRRDVAGRKIQKRHNPGLDNFPPPPPITNIITFDILGTIIEINTTSLQSIETPLGHYFLRFRDFTEQLVAEAFFGVTFFGFPPGSDD